MSQEDIRSRVIPLNAVLMRKIRRSALCRGSGLYATCISQVEMASVWIHIFTMVIKYRLTMIPCSMKLIVYDKDRASAVKCAVR